MNHEQISYEEMKAKYEKWMRGEIVFEVTQAGFFLNYGWTRDKFFEEAYNRGDDVRLD